MSFHATVITLYPEMFPGHLGLSIAGRALKSGIWSINPIQVRDFALDTHRSVDDTPAGGGSGMILKPDVLARAIDYASESYSIKGLVNIPQLLMSPRGQPLTQERIKNIAMCPGVIIICGRFEGVDERVIEARSLEEISIGDYILSGGEAAALVLLDAIVRLLPSVIGNKNSILHESFENGLLEYPQYTKPRVWEGLKIPDILSSGHHRGIEKWRQEKSLTLTRKRRPDLLVKKREIS
ncbi:tRNA (Guanine37-N1)-methyltransferase [Liberibacter crescens BT-1]|uniref:tRNA (guanine-N(1)-)-methyltransferase n=1 Tax=Liberibacter crescens (strain BT-1) TaxID=1215343 RepID=L0EX75_LIBCB|nr:tRNA (guanosine(37)-N1)-methyltransferase TrmD [Liberibacter crescens]AGA65263.1 tRNA (Guanine37-N1)-methyltransferase [Liberibacter crescens BT-1]AMC13199.1 tRNA (guanine-N1)-methyltransferase [Liberibacter crescens]